MKRTILLIAVAVLLATACGYSQTAPSGVAFRLTQTNFQYPLTNKWIGADFQSGIEAEYIHSGVV